MRIAPSPHELTRQPGVIGLRDRDDIFAVVSKQHWYHQLVVSNSAAERRRGRASRPMAGRRRRFVPVLEIIVEQAAI